MRPDWTRSSVRPSSRNHPSEQELLRLAFLICVQSHMASSRVTRQGGKALSGHDNRTAICQSKQPTSILPQRPAHATPIGCEHLYVPENILFGIASHMTLDDWVKGPAQACRSLNESPLQHVILDVAKFDVLSKVDNKLVHGLKWAVPRIKCNTRSIEVRIGEHVLTPGLPLDSALQDVLSSKTDLSSIRCFKTNAAMPTTKAFAEWVLQHASRIEALQLLRSEAQLGKLQHLNHLEMQAHAFAQGASKAAEQLPSLETLYLHARKLVEGALDVVGCHHLRHLVVKGRFAHALQVEHGPKCRLEVHVSGQSLKHIYFTNREAGRAISEATPDLYLHAEKPKSCQCLHGSGMCARFARIRTLPLDWPVNREKRTDKPDTRHAFEEAKGLLGTFMPANGQPLRSLKRLIIVANGAIICSIPGGLPNLEELVLYAGGIAEVSFDNPTSTLSRVKTLYVFGQPLPNMGDSDLSSAKDKAAKRGLSLSIASTKKAGKGYRRHSACMYLRPFATPELSFKEAYERVSILAKQCRCRACSDCLSREGCLPYS